MTNTINIIPAIAGNPVELHLLPAETADIAVQVVKNREQRLALNNWRFL